MKKSQEVSIASPEYRQFIEDLKAHVLSTRLSAERAVNRDLILLYRDIGRDIVEKQQVLRLGGVGGGNGFGGLATGVSTDDRLFAAQCVGHAPALCNLHGS
jgi:hypothetical protein